MSGLMALTVGLMGVGCGQGVPTEVCATGTYDDDGDRSTECVSWSVCDAGEYVSAAGTADADRECSACAAGAYAVTTNAASCSAWTGCAAGEYVSAAGTAVSDQVCAGCTSGTYSASVNAAACAAWTECSAGTYVSTAGSANADQACTACAEGTFTSGPNQTMCVALTDCAPGTVQTAAATATGPAVCEACSAGQHCPGGEAAAVSCDDGDGTWDHDGDASTACVARTACSAGTYVSAEGSAEVDRSCTACATGTYTGTANQSTCAAWQVCSAGYMEGAAGSTTMDRTCILDACSGATVCTGTWVSSSVMFDYTCVADPPGYYCQGQFPMWSVSNADLQAEGRFTLQAADTVVLDTVSGLAWQRTVDGNSYTQTNAGAYCDGLALDGGGWRLPQKSELESILDPSVINPSITATAFPATPAAAFWTASPFVDLADWGWIVYFDVGLSDVDPATVSHRVRCVR